MAGGKAQRFWPLSLKKPKPFLSFFEDKTFLRATFERLSRLLPLSQLFVVIPKDLFSLSREELKELPFENFILEPEGRDTAACIGFSTLKLSLKDEKAVCAFLPADHYIGDDDLFLKSLRDSFELAEREEYIITLGIKPQRPETGYGYIKIKDLFDKKKKCYRIEGFFEKPKLDQAKVFFKKGDYFWNSGIFVFKANLLLDGLKRHMFELFLGLERIKEALKKGRSTEIDSIYRDLPIISIDYGLMEKEKRILMIKAEFPWDDVGNFSSLFRFLKKDSKGNYKKGEIYEIDATDSLIIGDDIRVGVIGISNLIVVASKDGVLVCAAERAQDLKLLFQ